MKKYLLALIVFISFFSLKVLAEYQSNGYQIINFY